MGFKIPRTYIERLLRHVKTKPGARHGRHFLLGVLGVAQGFDAIGPELLLFGEGAGGPQLVLRAAAGLVHGFIDILPGQSLGLELCLDGAAGLALAAQGGGFGLGEAVVVQQARGQIPSDEVLYHWMEFIFR